MSLCNAFFFQVERLISFEKVQIKSIMLMSSMLHIRRNEYSGYLHTCTRFILLTFKLWVCLQIHAYVLQITTYDLGRSKYYTSFIHNFLMQKCLICDRKSSISSMMKINGERSTMMS